MGCKGTCTKHKVTKQFGASRYDIGQKMCSVCNIFMKWDGVYCPCCGNRIRSKPRTIK